MGHIYKRGRIWWIKYHRAGKPYYESSKSIKESDAKKFLKSREGQIADNRFLGLKVERIRFEELAQGVIADYQMNKKKSLDRLERSIKHLQSFFASMKAIDITTESVNNYIRKRQEKMAENATINRELSALKRMFNLAKRMTPPKVVNVPFIPHLQEDNQRVGFFEHQEFLALRNALPFRLKPAMTMEYQCGMRREEILGIQWPQVDVVTGKVSLKPQDTKNREPRFFFMEGELLEMIRLQKAFRDRKFPKCVWVFFNEQGERIKDFRSAWKAACKKTGLEGKLFHDFRRTAVRNMVRAGISESVAMKISGHKTRSVFDRYDIANENDFKIAANKITEYHREQSYKTVTVPSFEGDSPHRDGIITH